MENEDDLDVVVERCHRIILVISKDSVDGHMKQERFQQSIDDLLRYVHRLFLRFKPFSL